VPEALIPERLRVLPYSDIVVWIDPLDGTANFVHRDTQAATTLIGLSYNSISIIGLVHQLCSSPPTTYWVLPNKGGQDIGVYCTTDLTYGSLISKPDLLSHWRVAVSQHHAKQRTNDCVAAIAPPEVLRIGGCGFKFIAVLTGQVSDYFICESVTNKWDSCAGEALMKAMGGIVTNIYGGDLTYRLEDRQLKNEGLLVTYDRSHFEAIVRENSRLS
jgi:3'(2'), 5'-bisphosphate nucleotidase